MRDEPAGPRLRTTAVIATLVLICVIVGLILSGELDDSAETRDDDAASNAPA